MSNRNGSLSYLALQRFKNLWGVLSFTVIVLIGFVAVFAYLLAPDNSENANQMQISLHSKPPGFKATMLTIPSQLKTNSPIYLNGFLAIRTPIIKSLLAVIKLKMSF